MYIYADFKLLYDNDIVKYNVVFDSIESFRLHIDTVGIQPDRIRMMPNKAENIQ